MLLCTDVLNYFLWQIQFAFGDLGDSALFINLKTSADALRKPLPTVLYSLKKPLPCLVILSWQKIRECLGGSNPSRSDLLYFPIGCHSTRDESLPYARGVFQLTMHRIYNSSLSYRFRGCKTANLYHILGDIAASSSSFTLNYNLSNVHRDDFLFPNYYRRSFKTLIIITGNQQIFQHLFSGPLPFRGDGLQGGHNFEGIHNAVHPNSKGSP